MKFSSALKLNKKLKFIFQQIIIAEFNSTLSWLCSLSFFCELLYLYMYCTDEYCIRETQMNLIMNFPTKEQQLQQYEGKKKRRKKCHLSNPQHHSCNMITLNWAYRVYVKRWWCTRVFSKSKVLIHIVSILYLKVNTILSSGFVMKMLGISHKKSLWSSCAECGKNKLKMLLTVYVIEVSIIFVDGSLSLLIVKWRCRAVGRFNFLYNFCLNHI